MNTSVVVAGVLLIDVDGVVAEVAQMERVATDFANKLGGWSRASAPDEGAEDEESEDK